ncbi:MAG: thioredoxin domain-containing protein [Desulfobaccales bacterium]|nr:thioredoxin domain-containing protein [Desulfobaccales bacterium]
MEQQRRPNRLAQATSPYLRQHAHNPVDWYPWSPEALETARREDKPIFLSIGYSTCHWCHVMAHECFENPAIAALMNEHFINIKLDREERPDLDETYMNVVQLLTGRGGWPLSVFLTPDLKPFYGGTYFPPEDRAGLPGFSRLLLAMSQAYRKNQEQIAALSGKLLSQLQIMGEMPGTAGEPDPEQVSQAAQRLLADIDPQHGGLGSAPKFPRSLELGFLLHYYRFWGEAQALEKLAFTLEKMARGGIYDQLGGGFHRYTVDAAWVVPHFEKMLYDNALLAPLYLALYQLTGSPLARRIAGETLDFVLRDMHAPQGGFYAAWDADSEGEEGKYYVWSLAEVEKIVGPGGAPNGRGSGDDPGGEF